MATIGENSRAGSSPARATATEATATEATATREAPASTAHGKIEVSARAIATLAGRTVANSYGVVGIAARNPRLGIVELVTQENYSRGVDVKFAHDHVTIDLYVVLEHGLRITTIAHNIMANVKFAVEHMLGLGVVQVNVNVQALRVSPAK